MTLRKITIDISVNYVAQSEQAQSNSRLIKPNTMKNISLPRKQSKRPSKDNEKFIKDYITGQGFVLLK